MDTDYYFIRTLANIGCLNIMDNKDNNTCNYQSIFLNSRCIHSDGESAL